MALRAASDPAAPSEVTGAGASSVDLADDRFPARLERFDEVSSTNDVVAGWLRDGAPEVCVAIADRQTAGRGRLGRSWLAPAGGALLLSAGFRPSWLAPERLWRLPAIVALAMADAAEQVAGLAEGTIRLKWPNDLVVAFGAAGRPIGGGAVIGPDTPIDVRKLAGILGETDGLGTPAPRAVVGIGINADWVRDDFPVELAADMTSLRDASGGRPIDREALLQAFLDRLETRAEALKGGYFDVAGWSERQLTSGRRVGLELPDGTSELVRAIAVDALTGALVVEGERQVLVGEIRHVRLDEAASAKGRV